MRGQVSKPNPMFPLEYRAEYTVNAASVR